VRREDLGVRRDRRWRAEAKRLFSQRRYRRLQVSRVRKPSHTSRQSLIRCVLACSSNSVSASLSPQTRRATGGCHDQEGPTHDSSWYPIRPVRPTIQAHCPASRSCCLLSSTVVIGRIDILPAPANVWQEVGEQRRAGIGS
jgi:hypothetical protein